MTTVAQSSWRNCHRGVEDPVHCRQTDIVVCPHNELTLIEVNTPRTQQILADQHTPPRLTVDKVNKHQNLSDFNLAGSVLESNTEPSSGITPQDRTPSTVWVGWNPLSQTRTESP